MVAPPPPPGTDAIGLAVADTKVVVAPLYGALVEVTTWADPWHVAEDTSARVTGTVEVAGEDVSKPVVVVPDIAVSPEEGGSDEGVLVPAQGNNTSRAWQ